MLSLESLGRILVLISLNYGLSPCYFFSLEAEKGKTSKLFVLEQPGCFSDPLAPTKSQTNLNGYFTIEEMCFR